MQRYLLTRPNGPGRHWRKRNIIIESTRLNMNLVKASTLEIAKKNGDAYRASFPNAHDGYE